MSAVDVPFKSILENVASGVLVASAEGRLLYVNSAAARLFQLPVAELLQGNLADLLPQKSSPSLQQILASVIATGETLAGINLAIDPETHVRVTIAPLHDPAQGIIALVLTLSEPLLPGSFYAELLAQAPIGISVFDGVEFRLRWTNEAYRQFLEEPYRSDPVGVPFRDLVPESEERGVLDIFRRVAATRIPFVNPEFKHIGFARGVTYWRWALIPLPGGQDPPDLMIVATEVTEQVTMRLQVEARRARLRTVLDTLPLGVMIIEPDGRIVEANQMVHRIWRGTVPLAENIAAWRDYWGTEPATGIPLQPEDWPASQALCGETVLGKVVDIERLDGSRGTILVSAAPLPAADGGLTGAVAVFQDITEQRFAEQALREKDRLFRVVFDEAFQFMGLLTVDGTLIQINRAAAEFLEVDADAVLGRAFPETPWWTHSAEEQRKVREAIQTAAGGGFVRFETSHRRPDGSLMYVDFSLKPVFDDAGQVALLVPEGRDITDRRWLEDELRRAKNAAEASNKAKSEFLATVSHELRTPLTIIMGMIDLALEQFPDPEICDFLAMTQNSSTSLLMLINDIIDVSRMETGRLIFAETPFRLRACLDAVIESFSADAEEKGLQLSCEIADDVPEEIHSDSERVRQVLVNLIGNAVKFTYSGSIAVRVSCCLEAIGHPELLFAIRDTGIGIPDEKRQQLFQTFSQVDSSDTRQFGGTGLGLAISKGIIDRLGGRIWMEGGSGGGCTFYFTLPDRRNR
jgi:two-component system, cell cycle sensor histidine kinase DivJ